MFLFKKYFNSCPNPNDVAPIVKKSLKRRLRKNEVVSRQTILKDVKRRVSSRFFFIPHRNPKGSFDPVMDHMIDIALSNLKASRYIKTAGRGLYQSC